VQASSTWRPPAGVLGEILAETRRRLASLDRPDRSARAWDGATANSARPPLAPALRLPFVAVIAEIKRRSPSRGSINPGLDAAGQARRYDEAGASAISVLTEPSRFGGTLGDLSDAAGATGLPLLRKDFHVHPGQLAEARRAGASAILLIARALPPSDLVALADQARGMSLEPVIEVRTEAELEAALEARAGVVGVNSRDLESLEVDPSVPARLIPRIPREVIAVWESGIASADDVRRAADHGADAVLVGTSLSGAADPRSALRELASVPRASRG